MQKITFQNDRKVFGFRVETFPAGIGEAFASLIERIAEEPGRSYYGIGQMLNNEVVYVAAAEEKYDGEAEKYNCVSYTIKKGEYVTEVVKDWRKKTDCIKDVFHEMMQNNRFDNSQPCIEWYKDDDEMFCMLKS